MPSFDLYTAMRTQRAIRQFKPDPVPPELVYQVLQSAVRAPNGGNRQPWAFMVVTDPELRRQISDLYREGANERRSITHPEAPPPAPGSGGAPDAPVYILPCVDTADTPEGFTRGAHIYPAVQNLMLAARGLSLGTVITTLHKRREEQVKALLGIPDNFETACLIPLGYPHQEVHFGGGRRKPVEEVTHLNRWGASFSP